jgi:2-dehydro-3-deoxyphosphogluconate aldolase/(4S)-4-hydroxy-2-oxoglutarate aldolase
MEKAFSPDLADKISATGLVAVLVVEEAAQALPLAQALWDGGIRALELTLRTPVAMESLRLLRREMPEMLTGAGTVLTPAQVLEVKEAGASFAVSPGTNRRVLAAAQEAGLSFAPGVATPSDIETALEFDCQLLKFFPAEPGGGISYLQSMAAPYAHLGLRYIPLGGVNAANLASYASVPQVAAIGGSWLAPKEHLRVGNWSIITQLASDALQVIAAARA